MEVFNRPIFRWGLVLVFFLLLAIGTTAVASEVAPDSRFEQDFGISLSQANSIFEYSCERTFLEGSGISESTIACVEGMELGLLRAKYHYYLYLNHGDGTNNFNNRGQDVWYSGTHGNLTCGMYINKITCSSPSQNRLVYGVSRIATDVFNVAVTLTSGPEPNGRQSFVGFVAAPDANLVCPAHTMPVRPLQAVPATHSLPSNFVNTTGELNNTRLLPPYEAIEDWTLNRFAPGGVCDSNGVCPPPAGGSSTTQVVAYDALNPLVCVIPPERMPN